MVTLYINREVSKTMIMMMIAKTMVATTSFLYYRNYSKCFYHTPYRGNSYISIFLEN